MLKLVSDNSRRAAPSTGVPKCILLYEHLLTIGRGYKCDIKLLLPFVSRRHFTLTYIDGRHFLESVQQSVVFVNDVRLRCKMLTDGCLLTIGGTSKSFSEGSTIPSWAGPHLVYRYHVVLDPGTSDIYCNPHFDASELLTLEEWVNGKLVKETYHMEDFNGTDDECTSSSSQLSIGGTQKLPPSSTGRNPQSSLHDDLLLPHGNYYDDNDADLGICRRHSGAPCFCIACHNERTSLSPSSAAASTSVASAGMFTSAVRNATRSSANTSSLSNLVQYSSGEDSQTVSGNCPKSQAATLSAADTFQNNELSSTTSSARKADSVMTAGLCALPGSSATRNDSALTGHDFQNDENGIAIVTSDKPGSSSLMEIDTKQQYIPLSPCLSSSASKKTKLREEDMSAEGLQQGPVNWMTENSPLKKFRCSLDRYVDVGKSDRNLRRLSKKLDHGLDSDDNDLDYDNDENVDPDFKLRPGRDGLQQKRRGKAKSTTASMKFAIADWKVDYEEVKPPKLVTILTLPADKTGCDLLCSFEDMSFKVATVNKNHKSIAVDVSQLEYRLKIGLVAIGDIQLLFKVIKKTIPDTSMLKGLLCNGIVRCNQQAEVRDRLSLNHMFKKSDSSAPILKGKTFGVSPVLDVGKNNVFDVGHSSLNYKSDISSSSHSLDQVSKMSIKMKSYQVASVRWMLDIEHHQGTDWYHPCGHKVPGCNLEFDMMKETVIFPPVEPRSEIGNIRLQVKGGILADEMGLGKTITMIGLIMENRGTHIPAIPDRQAVMNGNLLECRATLIIAPSHLIHQWQEELQKYVKGVNVIVISTKPQHESVRYIDILESDVVIISVQFILQNDHFIKMPKGNEALASLYYLARRPGHNILMQHGPNLNHFAWWRLICDEAHEIVCYQRKKDGTDPSLGLRTLLDFTAVNKWYVTGTPFPHGIESLRGALRFLEFKVLSEPRAMEYDGSVRFDKLVVNPEQVSKDGSKQPAKKTRKMLYDERCATSAVSRKLYLGPIVDFVCKRLFIKNTKDLVKCEYDIPQYIEELMLLKMSDVERGIYNHCINETEKRQMCCHLQVVKRLQEVVGPELMTLDEVKGVMIAHTKVEISETEVDIRLTGKDLDRARKDLIHETAASKILIIENRINRLELTRSDLESKLRQQRSAVAYFESLSSRNVAQSTSEPCVICFETITRLTVTPCGHLFCYGCIKMCVSANKSCPTCRKGCTEDKLIEVKDKVQHDNLNKEAELNQLTEKFGTKMAYLIFYLRYLFKDSPKSRVIIFSQWDTMLQLVGQTLEENGISNVFVKGNVFMRNRAIDRFKKLNTRVIMLSLEHAASGTNLTVATHIILLDPVAGTESEASAVEQQAIGRAHRMGQNKQLTVVHMIMRDTIEQTLYERNKRKHAAEVSLNITEDSANNNFGVQVVRTVREMPSADSAGSSIRC